MSVWADGAQTSWGQMGADCRRLALVLQRAPLSLCRPAGSGHRAGPLLTHSVSLLPTQASSQSMPWLADLVQSSEGSLDVLPVQCLCEFLLHDAADATASGEEDDEGESREQKAKKRQVWDPSHPPHQLYPSSGPDSASWSTEAAETAAAAGPPAGSAARP